MSGGRASDNPNGYWDRAGEQGYSQAMFRSAAVASRVHGRLWRFALDIAGMLDVPADGHVIDVGCGDGAFANQMLASHYRAVDGLDLSDAAIRRARSEAQSNASFRAVDLTTFDYDSLPRYDAAFLMGILHHVKQATPDIVRALTKRTNRMIVQEPNGNHVLRKALEFTPTYRDAGEDSFRTKELMAIFQAAGWRTVHWRRVNLFPNFTPRLVHRWLEPIEPYVEANRFLNALCTDNFYGLTRA